MGAVCILVACVGGALFACARRREALNRAGALASSLAGMGRELARQAQDTDSLLTWAEGATRDRVRAFYAGVRTALNREPEVPLAVHWRQATGSLGLSPDLAELFCGAGALLGRYEVETQCRGLQEAAEAMTREVQSAKEEERRIGKLYLTLGACGGVFLLVLLW
jgi:hypothetical protein